MISEILSHCRKLFSDGNVMAQSLSLHVLQNIVPCGHTKIIEVTGLAIRS